MRFPQPFGLKAILVGLGSVALFASSAKSQENPLIHEASVQIGEVGAFAENFGWFPLFPAVSSRVTFDNNKTLTSGPGELSFFVDCPSCLLGYAGELLDATGTPIPGTMYTGVVNGDAAKIELSQTTTFSGMSFVPLGDISQTFGLVWVTPPTVGEPPSGDEAPVAAAGGPYSGTAGVDVAFDGSGSSDDLSITTYEWAFGDGQMGVGVAPVHNYATADTYNVTLTVRDGGGLASSDNTTATIGATDVPPVADAGGDYAGTVGEPVSFDGSGSSDDVGIASYAWDFGDASPLGTGVSPQHMYASAGPYTVQLTVTDASGNDAVDSAAVSIGEGNLPPEADAGPPVSGVAGVAVAFDGSGSSDPGGAITEYLWNFGDGSPTVNGGPTPDHTYARFGAYEVTLRVTDPNDGAVSDTDYTTADIVADNQAPVAEANGPYAGSVGVAVLFDSSGSVDPDGMIDTYVWSFGDGTSGLGDSPSHAYADDGNCPSTLRIFRPPPIPVDRIAAWSGCL
jgi:PKD repeat protein